MVTLLDFELTKLMEELGELTQICAKVQLWGIEGIHPRTRISNEDRMIEEMGDVITHLNRVQKILDIPIEALEARMLIKNKKVDEYHKELMESLR